MKDKIKDLEAISRGLETTNQQRKTWNKATTAFADEFLNTIRDNKTFYTDRGKSKAINDFGIPDAPRSIDELLALFKEEVTQVALNAASGGHMGYIPGGGVFPTALGDYLAAVTNEYAGIFFASPGAVRMENLLIRWMCNLMGYPEHSLGNLTSGGSIANLIAIATARDTQEIRAASIPTSVIYLTQQVHHSIQKAIRIAGLGECQMRYVKTNDYFQMDIEDLLRTIQKDKEAGLRPFLLVGSIGTTDTGAVDPISGLADIAEQEQMWFHIDAAYGGFFILADEVKKEFKGVERSDSVTIDPHKGLFLSYGTGAVLIKNVKALQNTHYYKANYMQDAIVELSEPNPADLSPE